MPQTVNPAIEGLRAAGEVMSSDGHQHLLITEINNTWEQRMAQAQTVFHERLHMLERELASTEKRGGFAVPELPLLINLCPHPLAGEPLAYVIKPGETYCGTDDDELTDETKDDIRLSDGFNLSNPHCIFELHENGEVEMIPLNGSLSYVNGHLLTTTYMLQHGCRIVLGSSHLFLFVDAKRSKHIRDRIKQHGGGTPRVLDWEFASREFAEQMDSVCRPETLQILRHEKDLISEEWEKLRNTHECLAAQFHEYRNLPFLVQLIDDVSEPLQHNLIYHMKVGKNTVGFTGDISPPGAKQLLLLNYDQKSGKVSLLQGSKSSAEPLPHGATITSGDCKFQLLCPADDRTVDIENARLAQLNGEPIEESQQGVLEDYLFMEDLKQRVFELQFQVLNLHNQLFPPPTIPMQEDPETGEPLPVELSEEELQREDKRKILKEDWILSSKKIAGREIIHHVGYLLHELRWLTYVSAQREQYIEKLVQQLPSDPAAPPATEGGSTATDAGTAAREGGEDLVHLAEISRLENQLSALKAHTQCLETENKTLQKVAIKCKEKEIECEHLIEENSILIQQRKRLMEEIREHKKVNQETQDVMDKLEEMTRKYQQLTDAHQDLQQQKGENASAGSDLQKVQDQINALTKELQTSEDIRIGLSRDLADLNEQNAELEQELRAAEHGPTDTVPMQQFQEVEGQLRQAKEEIVELQRATQMKEEQRAAADKLREEVTQLQQERTDLMQEMENRRKEEERTQAQESQLRIADLHDKLDVMTKQHHDLNISYKELQKKYQDSEKRSIEQAEYSKLDEDMKHINRKLSLAEQRSLQLQQKLDSRTSDYDTLYFTHQKLKEEMESNRVEVDDLRKQIKQFQVREQVPSSKDSVKAFNKMKETIKLLTKVAKSKDDKIAKLENDLKGKTDIMSSLNAKLTQTDRDTQSWKKLDLSAVMNNNGTNCVTSSHPTHISASNLVDDPSSVSVERIQHLRESMDNTMQLIKGEVITMNRSTVPLYDKVVSMVSKLGGNEVFKKGLQFIKKIIVEVCGEPPYPEDYWPIGEQDYEKIKSHHRCNLVKSLREMVISYDMLPDYIKGGIIAYDEISKNCRTLIQMSKFCALYERQRNARERDSPLRSVVSPFVDRQSSMESSKRSSSSHRYTTPTGSLSTPPIVTSSSHHTSMLSYVGSHSLERRDPSPTMKYANIRSRVAEYISPKRQSPTPQAASTTTMRTNSPRGASQAYAATMTNSSALKRTLSPRPGGTTPGRTKKCASPEPSHYLRSTTPSSHTITSPRPTSPISTPRGAYSGLGGGGAYAATKSPSSKRKVGGSGYTTPTHHALSADIPTTTSTMHHPLHTSLSAASIAMPGATVAAINQHRMLSGMDLGATTETINSITGGAMPPTSPEKGYLHAHSAPLEDSGTIGKRPVSTTVCNQAYLGLMGMPQKPTLAATGAHKVPNDAPSPTYLPPPVPTSPRDHQSGTVSPQVAHKGTYEIPGTISDLRQQTALRKSGTF